MVMVSEMVMRGGSRALVLIVVLAVAAGPALGTTEDGLPRPLGYPVLPSASYGPLPPAYKANGVAAKCQWYGFSYILYPVEGAACNAGMRTGLDNVTLLEPYTYYYHSDYVFDHTTNTSYCLYGCFDLSSWATAPAPGSDAAPPPVLLNPPPPASISSPPPPVLSAPPPVTLSNPPPATSSYPPPATSSYPPPATLSYPPPATLFTPPPAGATPDATTPPVLVNLNAAPGFLQPTAFVSFVLSAALLILAVF